MLIEIIINGTIKQTRLGKKSFDIILAALICPPIQSIVVVISPMGVHTPPALAAITTMPTNNKRSSWFLTSFLSNDTITMVVVRLSRMAERKNERKPTIQIKLRLFVLLTKR